MVNIGQPDAQKADSSTVSASSTGGLKFSMFRAKAGFVIPRNKLSGSLVPTIRGAKKSKVSDTASEQSIKRAQRKTRWGEDLTQDASVRRGRALAYQTRLEQITRQLKAGSLRIEDDQNDHLSGNVAVDELSSHQTENKEKLKLLELEKREAIGEVFKLSPSFMAPSDYKPLMKEECVPLPVNEHLGYNFVGFFFGPSGDTQKRMEKETGVKIQVYGTKTETGEKVLIKASDRGQTPNSYEEMHVQLSADSYEKIDTAIALIELLLSSVPGKSTVPSTSASRDVVSKSEDATSAPLTSSAMPSQGVEQPGSLSLPNPQGQFQPFGAPWFPPGPPHTSYTPLPTTSLAPPVSNPDYLSAAPLNSNLSLPLGPRPDLPAGFCPAPPISPMPQPSMQAFLRPFIPRAQPSGQFGSPSLQNPPPYSSPFQNNNSGPTQYIGHQLSAGPAGVPPNHMNASMPLGVQTVPPVSLSGPHSTSFQPMLPSTPQASAPMISGVSIPPQGSPMIPRPLHEPPFSPQINSSSTLPGQQFPPRGPVPNLSLHLPQSNTQNSGFSAVRSPSFTPLNPMTGVSPRPHLPSSGDFTFQPHRPPAIPPPAPNHGPGSHFPSQGGTSFMPPPSLGAPPFRQVMQSNSPLSVHPRLPFSNQMGSRFPGPAPGNSGGPFPPRAGAGSSSQFHPGMQPGNVFPPSQGFRSNVMFGAAGRSSAPVGQQVYDPFSPTSVSASPQVQGSNRAMTTKQDDDDPEYEDLMASVGVK